jgi:hypothetical protein
MMLFRGSFRLNALATENTECLGISKLMNWGKSGEMECGRAEVK